MSTIFGQVEPGDNWAGFELCPRDVVGKVAPVMYREWLRRLGTIDVFTRENALTVAL